MSEPFHYFRQAYVGPSQAAADIADAIEIYTILVVSAFTEITTRDLTKTKYIILEDGDVWSLYKADPDNTGAENLPLLVLDKENNRFRRIFTSSAATAINWRGTYAAGTSYNKGDGIEHLGKSYVSLTDANLGNTPATNPANWQLIADISLAAILAAAAPKTGTDAAVLAIDVENGDKLVHEFTITADRQLGFPTNVPNNGITIEVIIKQDGTGGHSLTFAAGYEASDAVAPAISAAANAETLLAIKVLSTDPARGWVFKPGQNFGSISA